ASATASRIAASPALKRKNFTPAWRETRTSVKAMPMPRCARKRKRTVERDMGRTGGTGRTGRKRAGRLPSRPSRLSCRSRPQSAQPLVDLRPVHHVPPRVDVVRAAVLVLQVVGVLPDVDPEDRLLAVHHRVVLVRRALDRDLAAVVHDPRPAAAEPPDGGLLE